jgi:AAA+ ATPase superfamily predicted ATPase
LRDSPAILVIDEFPWAVQANNGLDGLLQSLWDSELSRQPVLLILIGSDEAMMDRLFAHDRPLFGRIDDQMVVSPFNPAETGIALGGARGPMDIFDAQLVTGGFPELVAHARRFGEIAALIEDAVSRPHTLLADVAQINLAGELAESTSARLVLEAVGADEVGVVNFSGIAAMLGGGKTVETAVSRATDLLAAKGILAIDTPAGQRGGRLKRYRIADPYLRFWFRFIEPQLRNVEVGRPDLAVSAFRRSWTAWRGRAIEPIVREAVLRLAPRLDAPLSAIESVSPWWDRTGAHEWDIVGSQLDRLPVVVGSIKWRDRKQFDAQDFATLAAARSVIPHAESAQLLAVSAHGTAPGVRVDGALDAADLLSAWSA